MGVLAARELPRRSDAGFHDVRCMWIHPFVALDLFSVPLGASAESDNEGRAALCPEIRGYLEALLQQGAVEALSRYSLVELRFPKR